MNWKTLKCRKLYGSTTKGAVASQGVMLQRAMCCVLLVPLKTSPVVPRQPHRDAELLRCYFSPLMGASVWTLAVMCVRHQSPATVAGDGIGEASAASRCVL